MLSPLRDDRDELVSVAKFAKRADISISKAWDITNRHSPRFDHRAPRRIKLGGSTRFSVRECDAWIRTLMEEAE